MRGAEKRNHEYLLELPSETAARVRQVGGDGRTRYRAGYHGVPGKAAGVSVP